MNVQEAVQSITSFILSPCVKFRYYLFYGYDDKIVLGVQLMLSC